MNAPPEEADGSVLEDEDEDESESYPSFLDLVFRRTPARPHRRRICPGARVVLVECVVDVWCSSRMRSRGLPT